MRSNPSRRASAIRRRTAPGIPPGRLWRSGGRQATSRPGIRAVTSSSSRARAPQPITRARSAGGVPRSGRGTTFVDQPAGGLGGYARVATVGVRANGQPELLVQGRPADEDDVVVAHPAILEGLDDDF